MSLHASILPRYGGVVSYSVTSYLYVSAICVVSSVVRQNRSLDIIRNRMSNARQESGPPQEPRRHRKRTEGVRVDKGRTGRAVPCTAQDIHSSFFSQEDSSGVSTGC